MLDLHTEYEALGSVPDFFKAFQVFVGEPHEYPVLNQRSLMVKPGHETNIDLTATVLTASPDIAGIRPKDRKCYFSNEGTAAGLKLYKTYSHKSCVFECQIMLVNYNQQINNLLILTQGNCFSDEVRSLVLAALEGTKCLQSIPKQKLLCKT